MCRLLLVLGLAALPVFAQEKPQSVILDERHAAAVSLQCSRLGPPKFEGTWKPTQIDIRALEDNWPRLRQIKSGGGRVGEMHNYYRQYAGIVVAKRKLIYINAFKTGILSSDRWRREPLLACDGGDAFSGVIFDSETKDFSQLEFNGVA